MSNESKRLFTAVDVSQDVRERILGLRKILRNVEWHPAENFHVTVKFFGDVQADKLPQVESLLDFLGQSFSPVEVKFVRLKNVESRLRLVADYSKALHDMRATIEHNLKKIGIEHDDKVAYEPHITLGRIPKFLEIAEIDFDYKKLAFGADRIHLYQTIRGEKTATFKLLYSAKLRTV